MSSATAEQLAWLEDANFNTCKNLCDSDGRCQCFFYIQDTICIGSIARETSPSNIGANAYVRNGWSALSDGTDLAGIVQSTVIPVVRFDAKSLQDVNSPMRPANSYEDEKVP
jgi:hypothetical protein